MMIVGESTPITASPVFEVSNISVAAETLRKVGEIYWVEQGKTITVTADVALPDGEMMLMIERVVRGNIPVDDIRRPVVISGGRLHLQFTPRTDGNFLISAERLNNGLRDINKGFELAFNRLEFDVYAPA